jgi:hypothetical protein
MRKIAGVGHNNNRFEDYDPQTNPTGTVITDDWGNDVQDELIGIQNDLGIGEAAGTNYYVLAAIKGVTIKLSKQLGELFFLDDYKAPVEFDKDNPETFFPAKCLDAIDGKEDIDDANYPDLGPYLRAKRTYYRRGTSSEKKSFDVTGWQISSNTAILTFASQTAEQAILDDLLEDQKVNGSYGDWRTITLPNQIGDIPAGTYAIEAIDTASREVEFSLTAGDNSGTGSYVVEFAPHKLDDSLSGAGTKARLFEVSGRSIVSANDASDEVVSGLRRRDQMQEHFHRLDSSLGGGFYVGIRGTDPSAIGADLGDGGTGTNAAVRTQGAGSANNSNARTGSTTDPRSLGAHVYMWAKRYIA